jgi:hypothetical protein
VGERAAPSAGGSAVIALRIETGRIQVDFGLRALWPG